MQELFSSVFTNDAEKFMLFGYVLESEWCRDYPPFSFVGFVFFYFVIFFLIFGKQGMWIIGIVLILSLLWTNKGLSS